MGPEARYSLKLGFVDFWTKGHIPAFCEYFPLLEEDSRHTILVQSGLWPPFDAGLEVVSPWSFFICELWTSTESEIALVTVMVGG